MGLRDRLRRLRRAAEEDAVLIHQKDGSVRAFDKMAVVQELFLHKLDASLGRTPRRSEVMTALEGATLEEQRRVEELCGGGKFMEDMEPMDGPVPDLSEP